ncbi:MAG: hypothetical protein ACKVOL_04840 [Novosphingobium sp.]
MTSLGVLKLIHTLIWAFFVFAIAAIWGFAAAGNLTGAGWAIAVVMLEVAVLGLNHGRCPLGGIAARLTADRAANYDIYLPAWLAGRTKPIFGPLFVGGVLFTVLRWVMRSGWQP